MSVLSVMRNIRSEVDAGSISPYCFVEINGLKLASPENIYKVLLSVKRQLTIYYRKLTFVNKIIIYFFSGNL